jgi:putative heme transporter
MLAAMRSRRRVLLRGVLGLALVAVVFVWALPRIASYGSVAHQLGTISAGWGAAVAGAALFDVVTVALPWRTLLPQLSWLGALAFTQASTALTTVLPGGAPLGMAISFGLLRRLRVTAGEAGFAVALTGLWSQVMILLYPLAGAAIVLGSGSLSGTTVAIAAASGVAAAVIALAALAVLRSPATAHRLGETAGRVARPTARLLRRPAPTWSGRALLRLRRERLAHLRRRWPALTATTLVNQLSAYLVLVLSVRAVGVSSATLPATEIFLAWSIGRLISSLPLTPGGFGVVELGLIGTMVGFGAPHARVVAAVLLYRGVIILPTLAVGAAALVWFRFRRWPATAAVGEPPSS